MPWLKEKSAFIAASSLLGAALLLFLVAPIMGTILSSAGGLPSALRDQRVVDAISLSLYAALLATFFNLVTGVPLAYLLSRYRFPGRDLLDSLLDLSIMIPHNAAGIAILFTLSPRTSIGRLLARMGVSFVDTVWGIVAAMAFVSAPFVVRNAEVAFTAVDVRMEQVARSLGASRRQVFQYVTLPLSRRGIATGCLLAWARAVSEFGAVAVLAYYPKTAPVLLFDVLIGEGLQSALPITGLLLILGILVFTAFRVLNRGGRQ
ncbi:ABC transporter permease [Candidatus Bathyarchaeota archaeon]|nr:ABC transporter permease [Candidatus Bathyarchaeota archaeon]